jgi:hypothetical protein
MNILARLSRFYKSEVDRDKIMKLWNEFTNSNTEDEINNNWNLLMSFPNISQDFIIYLKTNWLTCKEKFVKVCLFFIFIFIFVNFRCTQKIFFI